MTGPGQGTDDTQEGHAGPGQCPDGNQNGYAGPGHRLNDSQPGAPGPGVWDPARLADLRAAGENLADLIKVRIAADHRARTLGHLDTELIRPAWVGDAEAQARQALQDA